MNSKLYTLVVMLLFISGCKTPSYLPDSEYIDVNQHGSYIKVFCINDPDVKGELIAIDWYRMFVLDAETKTCKVIMLKQISWFKLRYARPHHYGWTIPVYTSSTIMHGFLLIFSAPINLVVTIVVSSSGANAFTYSDLNMNFEKLKMFARFPQGLPEGLSPDAIK